MPFLIQYLVKLSISLTVVYLFYRFILRPLTFYTWNRWFLTGYSLIAFVIPFIDINPILSSIDPDRAVVINFIPLIDPRVLQNRSWFNIDNSWNWIMVAFLAGMVIMLIRLSAQFSSYRKLRRTSILLSDSPVKIFQVDKNIVPFSFGNSIFINCEQHAEHEMQEIIRHEFIHVKQKHTADMIWAEVLCILNWYNPFAWLIKRVICQNLEFIADQQVLINGLDKKEYQYLLLKVAGGASFRMTNQFNFSFLRKRIAMMNKMKSAKLHLVKFLFVLPLLAVLLLSFREKIEGLLDNPVDNNQKQSTGLVAPGADPIKLPSYDDTIPVTNKADTISLKVGKVIAAGKDSNDIFSANGKNQPLFIVDEIIQEASYVRDMDPETIESLEVLKDKQALQYGDKGKYGVIRIYTKPVKRTEAKKREKIEISLNSDNKLQLKSDSTTIAADSIFFNKEQAYYTPRDSMYIDASLDRGTNPYIFRVRGTSTNLQVLVIIDGKKQPLGTDLKNIDPDKIESVSVIKDIQAIKAYGPEGVNGVIIINTKQGLSGKKAPR
jgi:beta-lactamase regulating signal transducer with metallopeptidase domain